MNQPTIILVSGFKRSGKDTFATLLKEEIGNDLVSILSFATPIKDIIAKTLNISYDDLEYYKNGYTDILVSDGDDDNLIITDFREVLQRFGTEVMKPYFGDSVWADIAVRRIQNSNSNFIVIPDFRFNIEYQTMIDNFDNVITIRIDDENIISKDLHLSETEIIDFPFDYRINNTVKDLESFKNKIESFAKRVI